MLGIQRWIWSVLDIFYDQLRVCLEETWRMGHSIIVRDDFNTQVVFGIRGLLLDETAHSFDLVVANNDGDGEQDWTVESSIGVRRRIDFVLCSRSLHLRFADANSFLDLGSGHRTVTAVFGVAKVERSFRRTYFKTKGWQPQLDENGDPSITVHNSHAADTIFRNPIVQISTGSGAAKKIATTECERTTAEFQLFLRERRETQNRQERTRLSKKICKHIRKQLRAKRNKRVTQILDEFRTLNRLDSAFRDPIRSRKQFRVLSRQTMWLSSVFCVFFFLFAPVCCMSLWSPNFLWLAEFFKLASLHMCSVHQSEKSKVKKNPNRCVVTCPVVGLGW